MRLVSKADLSVNMNESVLRLQGNVTDQDSLEYRSSRTEEPFQELNRKSANLKKILSRIPDEITDRKTFLETIKEIASAIKKLLDAVNEVSAYIPGAQGKHALEQRKREFVKYSKKFSNTLKEYFKVTGLGLGRPIDRDMRVARRDSRPQCSPRPPTSSTRPTW
jgi:programmed cell death protein 10